MVLEVLTLAQKQTLRRELRGAPFIQDRLRLAKSRSAAIQVVNYLLLCPDSQKLYASFSLTKLRKAYLPACVRRQSRSQ
eukprot:6193454-Pleurochrysis_carterae.AAC.2